MGIELLLVLLFEAENDLNRDWAFHHAPCGADEYFRCISVVNVRFSPS